MEKTNKLTEKLKLLEAEINDCRSDLNAIKSKLTIAFNYENELNQRMVDAKKHTEELRRQFSIKSTEMSNKFVDMKNLFDIFTGNYFSNK